MADKLKDRISLLQEAEALAKARGKSLKPEAQAELDSYRKQGLVKSGADGGPQLTESQAKDTNFYTSALGANRDFEASGTSDAAGFGGDIARGILPRNVVNSNTSASRQKAEQAKADFIRASLRLESGAVINPDEFQRQDQIFFPQTGDSKDVLDQKARSRARLIQSFRIGAGPGAEAVDRYYEKAGTPLGAGGATPPAAGPNDGGPTSPNNGPDPRLYGGAAEGYAVPTFFELNATAKSVPSEAKRKAYGDLIDFLNSNPSEEQVRSFVASNPIYKPGFADELIKYHQGAKRWAASPGDLSDQVPLSANELQRNIDESQSGTVFMKNFSNDLFGGLPRAIATSSALDPDGMRAAAINSADKTHPGYAVAGRLTGAALGAAGGESLAARGLLRLGVSAERTAALAPRIGDATFGAISGAANNPDAPVKGALLGSVTALGGGEFGRGLTTGLAGGIAPTGGNAAPLYAAGVRPSLGQRVVNGGTDGSLKRTIGTIINGTEEAAQSIPGVGFFIRGTRQRARNQFQTGGFNDALSDIGLTLPADAQRGPAAFRFMDEAHSQAYDDVLPRMTAVADPQAIADTQAIVNRVRNGGLTGDSAERFDRLIENTVTRRMTGPNLAGPDLQSALSDLGKQIRALRRSPTGDQELADALDDYAQVIRDSAARNSAPEDAARLEAINRSYAKGVALANAAARAGGETAEFSPTQLLRSSQQVTGGTRSRPFLRGEGLLQDYAEAGRSLVDRLPNSGTADRLLTGQALVGAGGGVLGAVNPTTAAAAGVLSLPYAPIVRNATTALLAPRNSARLNTLGNLIRSNAQIPGAIGAGELLSLPSQYGN